MDTVADPLLQRAREGHPTAPEAGACREVLLDGAPFPAGYRRLRVRRRVGRGEAARQAAASSVLGWRMHRGAGIRVAVDRVRAEPGASVVGRIGVGPLTTAAPCRVMWQVDDARRAGFGYATLPGHPVTGEEAFLVELDDDGQVWFTVASFSRPVRWFTRASGPVLPLLQRVAAFGYTLAVRRAVRGAVPGGAGDGR